MVDIGPITFHLYGLMVGLGVFFGFWAAEEMRKRLVKQKKELGEFSVWDGFWWVIIPGIVLARLYHVIDYWDLYRVNILLIPQIWTGGMGIFGAIIGGAIGLWIYAKKRRIKLLKLLDLVAFGLPIGQAIGRWGNYINKELYGRPFDLVQEKIPFWAIHIDSNNRMNGYGEYGYYHPLFLYESLWSLLTFGVLIFLFKRNSVGIESGSYFFIYLILYGFGRYWLEELRIRTWMIGFFSMAQGISLLFILVGFIFIVRNRRA